MVAKINRYVESGLYSVGEAALYARVSTAMMTRWLFGTANHRAVIAPQFENAERQVTFLDLIQTLAIREIRIQRKVPLQKFRQAIKVAKKSLHLDYPFARQHCTYLFGDELVIKPAPEGAEFVEASGKHQGQRLFPFVETYLKDLTYTPEGLANEFQIFTSRDDVPIRMNPRLRFGEPLLPSGYTAMTIWDAIRAEGDIASAAKAYGIPRQEAEAAYQFVVNHLGKTTA